MFFVPKIRIPNCCKIINMNSWTDVKSRNFQPPEFPSLLTKELVTHIHTGCYAHVLNLVMSDVTGDVIQSITLFSLLNDLANFIKQSYKRMKKM